MPTCLRHTYLHHTYLTGTSNHLSIRRPIIYSTFLLRQGVRTYRECEALAVILFLFSGWFLYTAVAGRYWKDFIIMYQMTADMKGVSKWELVRGKLGMKHVREKLGLKLSSSRIAPQAPTGMLGVVRAAQKAQLAMARSTSSSSTQQQASMV